MMRPASSRKQASKKHYPVVGFPSGQREQTVNLPSSTSKVRILPPPPSLSTTSKFELPLVGFPSGQREQTVNLPSSTSKVRILPPPPSLSQQKKTESALVGRVRRSRHPATETYIGGKRRLTGELFTIDVLHWACSARPSSSASSCSIDRTTSLMTKQSSPVTLSLSIHSGIA